MHKSPLETINVARPCHAEWRWMWGNDRVRFCGQCNLNVYNLSAMTAEQAEDLIRNTEGQLCVRFYRRADGTVLTQNCPVGVKAFKAKLKAGRTRVIAFLLSFFGHLGLLWLTPRKPAISTVVGGIVISPEPIMGVMAPPFTAKRSEKYIREQAIFKATPIFSSAASPQGRSTRAVVNVTISPNGEILMAHCLTGPPAVREMAEEAARRWRFKPMLENGMPAQIESSLTFRFER